MKKAVFAILAMVACAIFPGNLAYGWHLEGRVQCPNGSTFKDVTILLSGSNCNGPFSGSASTDSEGYYVIVLPVCDGSYTASIDASTLPADATVTPSGPTSFTINDLNLTATINWSVNSAVCQQAACWFTGGGAKIDPLLDIYCAHCSSKPNGKNAELAFG